VALKFAHLDAFLKPILLDYLPNNALVITVSTEECVEWLVGHLSHAVDMLLVNEAQLAERIVLQLLVDVHDVALVKVLVLGNVGLLDGLEITLAIPTLIVTIHFLDEIIINVHEVSIVFFFIFVTLCELLLIHLDRHVLLFLLLHLGFFWLGLFV